nr:hypothetical protein [Tanacetum cinerariifolium]
MQQPEQVMSPYVIEVSHGLDIVTAVTTFCNQRDTGLCVLSGSGKVSYVSFKPPCCACYGASAPVVHEDFLAKFVTSIQAGPGGQILGGVVEGPLITSGTVYIVAASFNNPSYHRFTMEDVKEDKDNARYSGYGSVSEAKGELPESGGGDYGRELGSAIFVSCNVVLTDVYIPLKELFFLNKTENSGSCFSLRTS